MEKGNEESNKQKGVRGTFPTPFLILLDHCAGMNIRLMVQGT